MNGLWCLRAFALTAVVGAATTVAAADESPARPTPDVAVRTSLDRTAIWVADRATYTIELACKPGVDILDEDLARDKLKLDGLEILGADTARDTAPDGAVTHRYRYALTAYRVDLPELRIAPLAIRYYVKRPGQRLQDAVPAGEAQVPGAVIALRSMLPDNREMAALRDLPPVPERATLLAIAQPVGVGLVVASIAPVVFWGAAFVARQRHRAAHRSARQVRNEERASLESARALDVETPGGRREAYTRINTVLRDHLREVCGVAGQSLTPGEVVPALAKGRSRVPGETVAALLAECERALYAPPEAGPTADACREALSQAEQVLAIR